MPSKMLLLMILVQLLALGTLVTSQRKCDISDLDSSLCPPKSHCLQREHDGICSCDSGFLLNSLTTGDEDYCIQNATAALPAASSFSGTSSSSSAGAADSIPHHHIIGGILIPLVLVASSLGGAFLVVRYRVLQRVRDRVLSRRRRHRPTYHMGTEFDPPLI